MLALLQSPANGPAGQTAPAGLSGPLPVPAATDRLIDQLLERVEVPPAGAPPPFPMPSNLSSAFPPTDPALSAYPYPLLGGGAGAGGQLDPLVQELQQRRPIGSSMPAASQPARMPWPGKGPSRSRRVRLSQQAHDGG